MFDKSQEAMQKILVPENDVINTPEEVERYKPFLFIHAGNIEWMRGNDGERVSVYEIMNHANMPYTIEAKAPGLERYFITESELRAEAQEAPQNQLEALQERSAKLHSLEDWEAFKEEAEAFAQAVEYLMDDLNETLELANDLVNQAELNIDELGKHEPTYEQEGEAEYIRAIGG